MTGWSDPTSAGDRRMPPATRRAGRHRNRSAGTLTLVAIVAALLVGLGVTAAVLPASLTGAGQPGAGSAGSGTVAGAGGSGPLAGAPNPVTAPPASATAPTSMGAPTPTASVTPSPTVTPSRRSTPTPRRTSSTPAQSTGDPREAKVVTLVNQKRAANGCGPVRVNSRLATAARLHSVDQAAHDKMSHTGSDGSTPWDRARRAGYQQAIGENVAAGYRTPEAVMTGWMNSPGHRANILNCDARAIGVGVAAADDGTLYWTQMFGSAL